MFPGIAATPAGHDQHAQSVSKREEIVGLDFSFEADGVQIHIERIFHLLVQALVIAAQQHVEAPTSAANQQLLMIDLEQPVALLGKLAADSTHPELHGLLIAGSSTSGKAEAGRVKLLRS